MMYYLKFFIRTLIFMALLAADIYTLVLASTYSTLWLIAFAIVISAHITYTVWLLDN